MAGISEARPDEGFIHFMAEHKAVAKFKGHDLELLSAMSGEPIVIDKATGRSWEPTWDELVRAAEKGGLFKPASEVTFKKHEKKAA